MLVRVGRGASVSPAENKPEIERTKVETITITRIEVKNTKRDFRPIDPSLETGLIDSDGKMIFDGNMVSLGGNMTTDNSLGHLPNGWFFEEEDVYQVRFDRNIDNWSLDLDVEPDTLHNRKYINHALSLLHGKSVKIWTETNQKDLGR